MTTVTTICQSGLEPYESIHAPDSEAKVRGAENSRMSDWNPQYYLTLGIWAVISTDHTTSDLTWPVRPV